MSKPTEGHHVPDRLSDRQAGGLLLAFLVVVILVLALATMTVPTERSSTDEPDGQRSASVGRVDQ